MVELKDELLAAWCRRHANRCQYVLHDICQLYDDGVWVIGIAFLFTRDAFPEMPEKAGNFLLWFWNESYVTICDSEAEAREVFEDAVDEDNPAYYL